EALGAQVADVGGAGGEVLLFHRLELACHPFGDLGDRRLGVGAAADLLFDRIGEGRVLQDEGVGGEDLGGVVADLGPGLLLEAAQMGGDPLHRLVEALHLGVGVFGLPLGKRRQLVAVEVDGAHRHAAAGGDAFQQAAHASSVSTSSTRDRKSTRLNSSHVKISYAVFCLKK